MSRIRELADIISTNTCKIDEFLVSTNRPAPSFDFDAATSLNIPPDLEQLRTFVLDATTELNDLLTGPKELLLRNSPSHLISLHAIYHYKIAELFPVGAEATYTEISKLCGLNQPDLQRLLRHAITHHIFQEIRKGVIVHTSLSRMLAEDPHLQAWTGVCVEEMWPSAAQTVPAMIKWPNSQEPSHTGFALANNTNCSIYEEISKYPSRAKRFANGMSAFITAEGYETRHVVENIQWGLLGRETVVDIGGAHGDVAIAIAEANPLLEFIVQDLQPVVETRPRLPEYLESKITFMAHDFLTEQPVKGAAVYLFRWIFHNWSDRYCLRILQSLVPALKPKSTVIISDACLPEIDGVNWSMQRQIRAMDLSMLQIQNSKERDGDDWETLFKEADPRFHFIGVKQPQGSRLALIEAVWEP